MEEVESTSAVANVTVAVEAGCTQEVLDFVPSCLEFLEALGVAGWLLLGLATVALLMLLGLCAETGSHVVRYCHTRHKETTVIVLTVYPVLGLCSYLGLLFQKANLFLDAAAQLWFALCMWQFLDLTLSYFGGESRFVAKMEGAILPWKGPPCCCWPCCVCPQTTVNKRQIRFVKILVMQHPWVQLVVSIFQLTLWLEGWYTHMDMKPNNAYIYIYLISTTSFAFGLWAFIVGFKASLRQLQEFHYTPKIVTFQLCLVFLRLQAIIVNSILVPSGAIPCLPPISPRVFANSEATHSRRPHLQPQRGGPQFLQRYKVRQTLLNALLLGQLVVLSVLARHYYKLPTPEIVSLSHVDEAKEDASKIISDPHPTDSSTMISKGQSPGESKEEVQLLNHNGVSVV